MNAPVRVDKDRLRELVRDILVSVEVPTWDAEQIADHLVEADLRGVESHGVGRVGIYVERLKAGIVERVTHPEVVRESPVSALIDGGNGSGIVVACKSMDLATEKAARSGVGIVSVRHSNHCGRMAYYTQRAVRRGLIAFATTSAPSNMAPLGAAERFFGTNPFSYAVPTGGEVDIIFDMATSNVSRGKIIVADRRGQKIPVGWAIDRDGRQTTEPAEALQGLLLPLGGAKGSGLAFMVEILSSVLSGANFGPHIPPLYDDLENEQDVGHFFMAFRPDLFLSREEFTARMRQMIGEIRRLRVAEGHEKIYLPGEPEVERARERSSEGIPFTREALEELEGVASECGVPFDLLRGPVG